MLLLPPRKFLLSPSSKSSRVIVMGSMLLKSPAAPATYARIHSLHDCCPSSSSSRTFLFDYYSRSSSRFVASEKQLCLTYQRTSGYSCTPYSALPVPRPISGVKLKTDYAKLKQIIEALGVKAESCTPGQYDLLYCPKCNGGQSMQRTLSFHISRSWSFAMWRCFDLQCGWAGQAFAENEKENLHTNINGKVNSSRSGESLKLEPLDDELFVYFAERMISKETLLRNNVMQVAGGKKIIAFPYRQNGKLVGCKYRTLEKRFWQGRNTEKMLYGLDDIVDADEIIIVEGEIDKLSIEEAGYCNCVSVPGGAPQTVSFKEIPSQEKDTGFQYLWNCKDYFEKASSIILATDSDAPGQALAEELARRLGKDRCWRVRWPGEDGVSLFKDANEVLKSLGVDALRDTIDKAELYDDTQNLK